MNKATRLLVLVLVEEATTDSMPRIDTDIKLDFKDVLFRPKRSTIRSRADVSSD